MSFLSTYKIPQPRGYSEGAFYVEDTSETSPEYFNIEYFPLVMGGGRHVIKLKGNGLNMKLNSSIDVEIIDADGERVFCEVVDYYDRFNNYYISVDIYDITANGIATAYFVGEAIYDQNGDPIPAEYRDTYNLRWAKRFTILPFERNNADLIFDEPPQISAVQVLTPAQTPASSSTTQYQVVTSSANTLTIQDSNFQGYDREFASSADILDPRLKAIKVDPTHKPMTENTIPTTIRQRSENITNGYLLNTTTRFGTIITSSVDLFTKGMLGGYFEFFSIDTIPTTLSPTLPSNLTISGSAASQLETYSSTVVEVLNARTALVNKPLEVIAYDNSSKSQNKTTTYKYRSARGFTGSFTFVPTVDAFVTSSTVSQSYVEFTFTDLNPISGQVYRIKTSTKLGAQVGEYKLLNDQIIKPVEYLSDAAYPNSLNYARHESDYRLMGHFYKQGIIDDYWSGYLETPTSFDVVPRSYNNSVLADSLNMSAQYTQSAIATTIYNQNYNSNQTYTLGYNITLDPYSELEVYMLSDGLNTYVSSVAAYPRAFFKTPNNERDRYSDDYSRFGRFVGRIVNDQPVKKSYGNVVMDFGTDASGLGRPLFRLKSVDYSNITAQCWISEVSIKPYQINGFTPNIVQYAVPLSTELINAAALSQSIDFKIEYFDFTGKQSEYVTYIDDLVLNLKQSIPTNTCQDQKIYFYYSSTYLNNYQNKPTY